MDRGSNRTFATTECFKKCGLEKIASVSLYISAFGQPAKRTKLDVAKVTFFRDKKSLGGNVSVNVFIKDHIVQNVRLVAATY